MKISHFLTILLILLAGNAQSHPGIGIVADKRGNIYYSDLMHIWKINNGRKSIIMANVHSHELYLDRNDNLYGEHLVYRPGPGNKFYHYLWRRSPSGKIDTLVRTRRAYVENDFALARDINGYEYYTGFATERNIYKRLPGKKAQLFAAGDFKGVTWLHPQADGSLLYVKNNIVYRLRQNGRPVVLATHIAGNRPSFSLASGPLASGLWQDKHANVYAAVLSDRAVKKITAKGDVTIIYRSAAGMTPIHGIFDRNGRLWLLETSEKNDIRAIRTSYSESR